MFITGIITGILVSILVLVATLRYKTVISQTIDRMDIKVKGKPQGEIFMQDEVSEELESFINKLPTE